MLKKTENRKTAENVCRFVRIGLFLG